MTPGNFNWFLHCMLFYHTKYVLKQQEQKAAGVEDEEEQGVEEEMGI